MHRFIRCLQPSGILKLAPSAPGHLELYSAQPSDLRLGARLLSVSKDISRTVLILHSRISHHLYPDRWLPEELPMPS
jgi:hypothetical protein